MKLRTINPVPKADAFGDKDCYVIARLVNLNVVTGIHQVVYELEIPYEPAPGAELAYRIQHYKEFPDLTIVPQEINAVLASLETDLNAGYNYWENIQAAVHEVFRQKVGMDARFGLTAADWQKV